MSKSRKRLIVRLSLVSIVIALGVYALIQAQSSDREAGNDASNSSDGQPPQADSATSRTQLPSPEASVVRANDDNLPNPAGSEFLQISDQPFNRKPIGTGVEQEVTPASGGSFAGPGNSLRQPAPVLPPTQPPAFADSPAKRVTPPTNPNFLTDLQESPSSRSSNVRQAPPPAPFESTEQTEYSINDRTQRAEVQTPALEPPAPLRPSRMKQFAVDDNDANEDPHQAPAQFQQFAPNQAATPLRGELPLYETADAASTSGRPGPAHLEGIRTPSLALEKRVPAEIQVGKPAIFEIKVQNVGRVDAEQVNVLDKVPRGTRFVDSTPNAERSADGSLVWRLGTLAPGEEKVISMQLLPESEGEIGSVAQVSFSTLASARTICTKPQLTIELVAAPQVLIGESIEVAIRVANPGTGVATGVVVEEDIPDGLSHPAGNELEFEIGTLRPGESRDVNLTLKAEGAGRIENLVVVHADGNLTAKDAVPIEVIAPRLDIATNGPSKRYLERQATYSISVANPGTAPANDIELVAYLPKGMKFVESNNHGQYDAQNHAVFWSLAELPAKDQGAVQLTVLPVETGDMRLRVEGRADLGLTDSADHSVAVEGLAALFFDVADLADPIEVGSDTVYQVRVINQGSKTDTNIQIVATLPPELELIGGEGPTQHRIAGQQIVFSPLSRLAPNGDAVFKIQARGVRQRDPRTGDPKITVQLTSDEIRTPVTKEESTRVYSDR